MGQYLNYLPVLAVLIIYTARMLEIAKKRNLIKGEIKESTTLLLFKLVGLFTVIAGTLEYLFVRKAFHPACLIVGVCISLFSFYIRRQAIASLGKFWSLHVEIRENHEFVTSGPFKFVRHPAYSSMIWEIIAVGVILQAPYSIVSALAFFLPVLVRRISLEEKELIGKFGSGYEDYKKSTPALIPALL